MRESNLVWVLVAHIGIPLTVGFTFLLLAYADGSRQCERVRSGCRDCPGPDHFEHRSGWRSLRKCPAAEDVPRQERIRLGQYLVDCSKFVSLGDRDRPSEEDLYETISQPLQTAFPRAVPYFAAR